METHVDASTKYVAPHVRARLAAAAAAGGIEDDPKRREKQMRLRKQLKGYMNRLSEANMHKIANDIEAAYMQNSRNDANHTLTELMLDSLVAPSLSPERLVMEHAMLVAILHANVGSEVGSHVLQKFIERFAEMSATLATLAVENKQLDNVVLVLCHMYTFKVSQLDSKLYFKYGFINLLLYRPHIDFSTQFSVRNLNETCRTTERKIGRMYFACVAFRWLCSAQR